MIILKSKIKQIGSSLFGVRLIQLGGINKMAKFHHTSTWRRLRALKLAQEKKGDQ